MRKHSIKGDQLDTQQSDAVQKKKDELYALLQKIALSLLEAMAKKFLNEPEASEIARLHRELNCVAPTPEALENATLYCTNERCMGLSIE